MRNDEHNAARYNAYRHLYPVDLRVEQTLDSKRGTVVGHQCTPWAAVLVLLDGEEHPIALGSLYLRIVI